VLELAFELEFRLEVVLLQLGITFYILAFPFDEEKYRHYQRLRLLYH